MNCATHDNAQAVAYCRTCGKALCANCTRSVHGVIYCENCLAARLEGTQPQPTAYEAGTDQGLGLKPPPAPGTGPNPALAGILAGFFPGVGAVYAGQYAKGLAHMATFVLMILGIIHISGVVFGIGIGFFYVYQIIDAVQSARAVQMGQPAPDPFGLARTFGTGERGDSSNLPAGALILIGLGVLFLLHTMGIFFLSLDRFWPVILIAIGVWLFTRRCGWAGLSATSRRAQNLVGPAVLVTLGVLFLLETQDIISFGRTWPVLLVVIGLIKVLRGPRGGSPPGGFAGPPPGVPTGEAPPVPSEVKNG